MLGSCVGLRVCACPKHGPCAGGIYTAGATGIFHFYHFPPSAISPLHVSSHLFIYYSCISAAGLIVSGLHNSLQGSCSRYPTFHLLLTHHCRRLTFSVPFFVSEVSVLVPPSLRHLLTHNSRHLTVSGLYVFLLRSAYLFTSSLHLLLTHNLQTPRQ